MLISPTEPPALKKIGQVSMFPERYGCDLLFVAGARKYGIQRKEFDDFLSSVRDGRIGEQVARMQGVEQAMVVIEGRGQWTDAGELIHRYHKMSLDQMRKILWSVRDSGVWVDWSDHLADTIRLVQSFEEWCRKGNHTSLKTRPGPVNEWGQAGHRDWQLHFLQGLPGVGLRTAEDMLEQLGMPVTWRVSREELMKVKGIGAKKADRIMGALE